MYYALTTCYLCLHVPGDRNALHGGVRYLGFASPACEIGDCQRPGPADYENFHNLDLKMLTIGDDLYALITEQSSGALSEGDK